MFSYTTKPATLELLVVLFFYQHGSTFFIKKGGESMSWYEELLLWIGKWAQRG